MLELLKHCLSIAGINHIELLILVFVFAEILGWKLIFFNLIKSVVEVEEVWDFLLADQALTNRFYAKEPR